eukprot:4330258-Amphidinium_carterae.1
MRNCSLEIRSPASEEALSVAAFLTAFACSALPAPCCVSCSMRAGNRAASCAILRTHSAIAVRGLSAGSRCGAGIVQACKRA